MRPWVRPPPVVLGVAYGNAPARALRPSPGDAPLILGLSLLLVGLVALDVAMRAGRAVLGARGPG